MAASPVLKTPRLILRPITQNDAPAHYACMIDYDIVRWFAKGFPHPYAADGSASFIDMMLNQDKIVYWAIARKDAPETMIGSTELRPHVETSQVAFWLARAHHGQGLIFEALGAVHDYWFNTLGRETLHIENAAGNAASRRVQQKSGATLLGTRQGPHVDPDETEVKMWLLAKNDRKTASYL